MNNQFLCLALINWFPAYFDQIFFILIVMEFWPKTSNPRDKFLSSRTSVLFCSWYDLTAILKL